VRHADFLLDHAPELFQAISTGTEAAWAGRDEREQK
jgi:hypothetical protein